MVATFIEMGKMMGVGEGATGLKWGRGVGSQHLFAGVKFYIPEA